MGKTLGLPDKMCDIYQWLCGQQAWCSVDGLFYLLAVRGNCLSLLLHQIMCH